MRWRAFGKPTWIGVAMLAAIISGMLLGVEPRQAWASTLDLWFLPETGHYYGIVGPFDPGISWNSSKTDAATKSFMGVSGHLATLNSAAENDLIKQKLTTLHPDCFTAEAKFANTFRFGPWIGGSRPDNASDFEWLGEGPFADSAGTPLPGGYADFVTPPEPNGQNFVTFIDFTVRAVGGPALGWGDCADFQCLGASLPRPMCYVIEFDVPPERGGCNRP
ncbi:MAG: hypothetical protein GY725_01705 [bacterium]|nr:hypothetical protein [bacterium]